MARAVKEPPRQARRSELVLAAYRQIAEHGFEGLRTRDVAAAAGVNVATLHYYFPTKERLIEAVVEHAMGRFRTTLTPRGTPKDQLRAYLRGVRRLLQDEKELCLVMGELGLRASRDPKLAAVLGEMLALWHRTVRGLLRRAANDGSLDPEYNTDEVVAVIVSTLTAAANPASGRTADLAIRQLERWLGLDGGNGRAGRSVSSN